MLINPSVSGVMGDMPLEELAREAKKLGLVGIDLIGADRLGCFKEI